MPRPVITTIIPWCRRPVLEQTLRHNAPFFETMDAEVLVVNCGGETDELGRALASSGVDRVEQIDVPAPRFNRSLALNIGIHAASAEIVLLLDADVLLTCSLTPLAEACARNNCFLAFRGVTEQPHVPPPLELPPSSLLETIVLERFVTFVWADGTSTKVQSVYADTGRGRRLGPGLMMARRQHLLDIGGFRSDFECWGWEDLDVHLRLQHQLGLEPRYVSDELLHLTHGDEQRDLQGRTKAGAEQENFMRSCRSYAAADFMGTHRTDIETWLPVLRRTRMDRHRAAAR